MILHRRRHWSQRVMAPVKIELWPARDGPMLRFKGEDGVWYAIAPETEAEVKALLSAVHVLYHDFEESS